SVSAGIPASHLYDDRVPAAGVRSGAEEKQAAPRKRQVMAALDEIVGADIGTPDQFVHEIAEECRPVILRGLVAHWPAVQAANRSPLEFRDYVRCFDNGSAMEAFFGAPEIAGKYYYRDDLKG